MITIDVLRELGKMWDQLRYRKMTSDVSEPSVSIIVYFWKPKNAKIHLKVSNHPFFPQLSKVNELQFCEKKPTTDLLQFVFQQNLQTKYMIYKVIVSYFLRKFSDRLFLNCIFKCLVTHDNHCNWCFSRNFFRVRQEHVGQFSVSCVSFSGT